MYNEIMIDRKAVILPVLMILSVQAVISSILYFGNESEKISTYLTSETGKVAGASDTEIIDLSKEIPIMPGAEISGVDTSQNSASITISTTVPEEEIKTYYEDFMLLNNWQQISENEYQKDNRQLKVEITGNIIKITLTRV